VCQQEWEVVGWCRECTGVYARMRRVIVACGGVRVCSRMVVSVVFKKRASCAAHTNLLLASSFFPSLFAPARGAGALCGGVAWSVCSAKWRSGVGTERFSPGGGRARAQEIESVRA